MLNSSHDIVLMPHETTGLTIPVCRNKSEIKTTLEIGCFALAQKALLQNTEILWNMKTKLENIN